MMKATPTKTPLLDANAINSDAAFPENKSVTSAITMDIDGGVVREKKQGHKFFFFCCDSKRAVIWLNTAIFLLNLFTITAAIVGVDPETEGFMKVMIVRGCGMFVTLTTLLGAYWYSKSIVSVGLLFTTYQLATSVIKLTKHFREGGDGQLGLIFPVVFSMLNFYAESCFLSEMTDGTMSAETYKRREKYSCCCNC